MTIDEETERRESRQVKLQEKKPLPKKVKDRLIDACNHGQKRCVQIRLQTRTCPPLNILKINLANDIEIG